VPVLDAALDRVLEAAVPLAADFVAADFETDFLAVPVLAEAAALRGTAFVLVPEAVAVFFFGAGAC
jgi:hypothetical protein